MTKEYEEKLNKIYTPPCGMSVGGLALIMAYNDIKDGRSKSIEESFGTIPARLADAAAEEYRDRLEPFVEEAVLLNDEAQE